MLKLRNYRGEVELVSTKIYALVTGSARRWRFQVHEYSNVEIRERRESCMARNPWDPRRWVVCHKSLTGDPHRAFSSISFHQKLGGKEGALVRAGMLIEAYHQYMAETKGVSDAR